MWHRLIAAMAVRYGLAPDVLADADPGLFNALVREAEKWGPLIDEEVTGGD